MARQGFGKALRTAFAGVVVTLVVASAASATTYYLNDVTFDDGTMVTGSLSTNTYGFIDAYNLTTVGGTLPGHHYVDDINSIYNPGASAITFVNASPSYDGYLTLTTVNPTDGALPNALVTGANGPSLECSTYSCPNGLARYIVSGSLAATAPEPASWALMLVGVAAVGYGMRIGRRRSAIDTRLARARVT